MNHVGSNVRTGNDTGRRNRVLSVVCRIVEYVLVPIVICGLVALWLRAPVQAQEVRLAAGAGTIHSDGTWISLSAQVPQYPKVFVTGEKWEDNSAVALDYEFRWGAVTASVGAGLASHTSANIGRTGVAHFTAGYQPLKWLRAEVTHWSSPARDKGDNALLLQYVQRW